MTNQAKYLPNLDALRFLAASLVLFGHANSALFVSGYISQRSTLPIFTFAGLAVVFFFVLSGFLITYLLLLEKEKGEISVKQFYLKRILRIWPVYYLVVIISFAFFNHSQFFFWEGVTNIVDVYQKPALSALLLLLICPNVLLLFSRGLGYANPTWSIGVEEQFYLVWPWLMKSKHALTFILAIVLAIPFLNNGLLLHLPIKSSLLNKISQFFTSDYSFKIDAMAIGSLGAFAAHKHRKLLSATIFKKNFQFLLYAFTVVMLCFPGMLSYQFYSIIFLFLILNFSLNSNTIINLDFSIFRYLGKISYGIYMFHCFTLMPMAYLVFKVLGMSGSLYSLLLTCLLSLLTTVLISAISYQFFERYFLRLKSRFYKLEGSTRHLVPLEKGPGVHNSL